MEQTTRSTSTLIDALERAQEVAKGALKRSTVDRHLDCRGASRRMLHVLGTKRHVRLVSEHALDFVVGHVHDGPYVRLDSGDIKRSKLGAFIDHSEFPESPFLFFRSVVSLCLRCIRTSRVASFSEGWSRRRSPRAPAARARAVSTWAARMGAPQAARARAAGAPRAAARGARAGAQAGSAEA
jgi:hypothetical protein